ncbi:MAG: HEAT repeat domain-containing protein [Phycisphaerae bacterium]
MKRIFAISVVSVACAIAAAQTASAPATPSQPSAFVEQLSGKAAAPKWSPEALAAAYKSALDELMPGIAAAKIEDRAKSQLALEAMCVHASRPGSDAERVALCSELCRRIGPGNSTVARVWILRQLERIAGSESVETISALLAERDVIIRDLARRVLQACPAPAAGKRLRDMLAQTSDDDMRAAIIDALAARGESDSCGVVREFAASGDPGVKAAAIAAIAATCDAAAIDELIALARGEGETQAHATAALLRLCERASVAGKTDAAARGFEHVYQNQKRANDRIAGLRGMLSTVPTKALPIALDLLCAEDATLPQMTVAALLLDVKGEAAGAAIAERFAKCGPSGQAAIVATLAARGDSSATTTARTAIASEHEPVRVAALAALGRYAEASDVPTLVRIATEGTADEKKAARTALASAPTIRQGILDNLVPLKGEQRAALLRALGDRQDRDAVHTLMSFAEEFDPIVVTAALDALGEVAGDVEAAKLVTILTKLQGPTRDVAERTCVRVISRNPDVIRRVEPLLQAIHSGEVADHPSLLRVLGKLGGSAAFEALRLASQDPDAASVDAAVRGLAEWQSIEAIDALFGIALEAGTEVHRTLAIRGLVRLLKLPSDRTLDSTLQMVQRLLTGSKDMAEQRMLASALGEIPHLGALGVVRKMQGVEAIKDDVALAMVGISRGIAAENRALSIATLQEIQGGSFAEPVIEAARKALELIEQNAGSIGMWSFAGPFRTEGKKAEEVFDTGYPPEVPGAGGIEWKPLGARSKDNPWLFDLTRIESAGGARCVYVRTKVWSDTKRDARLELGSDDGVKAWLNGDIVHKKWAGRAVKAGDDKVAVELKEGWNVLMLKIGQDSGGWGFTCAVRGPGGEALEGMRVSVD